MHLIGFEPTTFGFGSRCDIHFATDAGQNCQLVYYTILFGNVNKKILF